MNDEDNNNEQQKWTAADIAVYILYTLAMFVFLFWAIYLVSREKKNDERIIHFLYAIILSPIYVLSHYLNNIF